MNIYYSAVMKINHQDENVVIIYERNGRLYVGFNSNENKKKKHKKIYLK